MKFINYRDLDENAVPRSVDVTLSREEMLLIARLLGRTSANERSEIFPDAGEVGSHLYRELVGRYFNVWWEDGVNGALRGDIE